MLKGHSIGEVENHCSGVCLQDGMLESTYNYRTWEVGVGDHKFMVILSYVAFAETLGFMRACSMNSNCS